MPYLFKTKNKPTKLPEAETITIDHHGVSVELKKLGSLTLAEKMAYEWFQAKLAKENEVSLAALPLTHWMIVACLAYQEIRMQTLNPKYVPDFSLATKIACGDRIDSLGIKDEAGNPIEGELFGKIWEQFWSKELLGWQEVAEAETDSDVAPSGKTLTGTKSIST